MWNIQKVISKGDYNYVLCPEHPKATKNGYVLEHRIVIENYLGRVLNDNEIVHHKNHNKKDNRLENLEVMNNREHNRKHGLLQGRQWVTLKCPQCGKIFEKKKNQTHLQRHSKYNCTCCSNSCRGKFFSNIQYHGLTDKLESAISENILACYIKYSDEDNSEETHL
jgi:hypothetical protein